MDKKRIIANWKSHKTAEEAIIFLDALKEVLPNVNLLNKEIIILPSYLSIPSVFAYIETEGLPVSLGAQDISGFEPGAYTGEVNGFQIAEFCKYVLINHSERRRYNHEADQEARSKVGMAKKYNVTPLFCIQNADAGIPDGVIDIMYEPPSAISTFQEGAQAQGNSEIEQVFAELKERMPTSHLYYGGSVTVENNARIMSIPGLAGVLVGNASLEIESFAELLLSF